VKDFLISILILLVLVAAFGTVESRIEFEYPFGNWAVPGNGGLPVPGDGEPGKANTFSFGTAKTKEETQDGTEDFCPITVEVVTEQKQEAQQKESVLPWVLLGIGYVFAAAVFVFAICCYIEYFKERKECRSTALRGGAFIYRRGRRKTPIPKSGCNPV
jgi:hypothetical protein